MNKNSASGPLTAVLAAALYAISTPCSKLLLTHVGPAMNAALLYLGAGFGMLILGLFRNFRHTYRREEKLSRSDLPYVAAMVLLDIAAPLLLMFGLTTASAANVSLLNNFEIVATSLIALLLFGEKVSGRLWLAIGLMTCACVLLTFEGRESLSFSYGSLLVLAACVCWGFENNCTRRLSGKDPLEIVVIKGLCSGTGALLIAFGSGEKFPPAGYAACSLLLGSVAYGLSIFFYIRAQRMLGAARTSAFYAVAPFIGAAFSLVFFRELPGPLFPAALALMAVGSWLASSGSADAAKNR